MASKCEVSIKAIFIFFITFLLTTSILTLPPSYAQESSRVEHKLRKRREYNSQQNGESYSKVHAGRSSRTDWKSGDGFFQSNSQQKVLDTEELKSLLKSLLTRLGELAGNESETLSVASLNAPVPSQDFDYASGTTRHSRRHINSLSARQCLLHGLWLSTVAGAAIELKPVKQHDRVEILAKIFELPDNPYPPLITSEWTGKGTISQESPTTLTIVFQEHIDGQAENHAKERVDTFAGDKDSPSGVPSAPISIQLPRTAVFVGQCLVCHGSPMLQGSWVVFPSTQTCGYASGPYMSILNNGFNGNEQQEFIPSNTPSQDAIYLLRRYK